MKMAGGRKWPLYRGYRSTEVAGSANQHSRRGTDGGRWPALRLDGTISIKPSFILPLASTTGESASGVAGGRAASRLDERSLPAGEEPYVRRGGTCWGGTLRREGTCLTREFYLCREGTLPYLWEECHLCRYQGGQAGPGCPPLAKFSWCVGMT